MTTSTSIATPISGVYGDLSPRVLLDVFETYSGSFRDLDRGIECRGDVLRYYRDALVAQMEAAGVEPGDRVILSLGNGPAFISALMAILTVGGSPLLLHADTPPAELERFATSYDVRFLLCEMQDRTLLRKVIPQLYSIEFELLPAFAWGEFVLDFEETIAEGKTRAEWPFPALPGVPLHPTSGTTGLPKIAVRPARAAIAEAEHYRQTMRVTSRDTILCIVPMSHAYGFGTSVMLPLVSGASVASSRRFNPRTVQQVLSRGGATIFPAVPAMLDLVATTTLSERMPPPRHVLSAGAPLSERTARTVLERLSLNVTPLYGTTETGGITVAVEEQPGCSGSCVGRPMAGVDVLIEPVDFTPSSVAPEVESSGAGISQDTLQNRDLEQRGTERIVSTLATTKDDLQELPSSTPMSQLVMDSPGTVRRVDAGNGIASKNSEFSRIESTKLESLSTEQSSATAERPGRVCIRSRSLMAGYLTRDGIDTTPIEGGFFETGDLGYRDEAGRIHLIAREKEVINVFGMKVIPGEVEAVLARHPEVTDVKVYAGTHRSGSQVVKAAVAGPPTLEVASLKAHCREHLVPYKRPETIVVMERLPRSPTGKIIKSELP